MDYEPRRWDKRPPMLSRLLLMATGGMTLVALLALIGIWQTGSRFFDQLNALFNPPQPTPEVDVRSIVIHQVRDASELTTTVFAMQAIVPTSQDRAIGKLTVGTTKLLYIAHGEVRAGVDLEALTAKDVEVRNDTLRIRIPPPRILDSKIDVNRSSVYDYNRGFLSLGPDVAPEVQTLAEREALQKIVAAACANSLLPEANDRAKFVVTQLLNQGRYKQVVVETQPPPPNACQPAIATSHRLNVPAPISSELRKAGSDQAHVAVK